MLVLGTRPTFTFPESYLLVGPVADAIPEPKRRKVTRLDFSQHSFNPLKDIDLKKARAIAEIIYAAYPQGENTLTVRNGKRALTRHLLTAKRLDDFPEGNDDASREVKDILSDIFLSQVLKDVLCRPNNFQLKGIVIADIDQAELGPLDAFLLTNFLVLAYKGHVVVPNFGLYACPFHVSLIRQGRLTAGLHFLDEVPLKIRQNLLLSGPRYGTGCSYEDAVELAKYDCPHRPATNEYNAYIERWMG